MDVKNRTVPVTEIVASMMEIFFYKQITEKIVDSHAT